MSWNLPVDRMRQLKGILDLALLVYPDMISQSHKHSEENGGNSHGEDVYKLKGLPTGMRSTVEHAANANKMLSLQEKTYCNCLAGVISIIPA